jgi:host factor-I protein
MEKLAQNIQDSFLNTARKDKTHVTIYLVSGVKLSGRIKSFDKYSLILENSGQEQLIFKHAISTVVTARHQAPGAGAATGTNQATQPATQAAPAQDSAAHGQQPAASHAELAEG